MPEVWPYVPDPTFSETIEWVTVIGTAYSAEMRGSLRGGRVTLQYLFNRGAEYQKAEALYRSDPLGDWWVPIWADASRPGAITSTDTTIAADVNADWGSKALIWQSCTDYQLVDVASVTTTLNLSAAVGADFASPVVMPVRQGFIVDPPEIGLSYRGSAGISVAFMLRDEVGASGSTYATYDSLPFLECSGAFIEPLSGALQRQYELVDSTFGPVSVQARRSVFEGRYSVTVAHRESTSRYAFRKFLGDIRGRDGAFWIKSWAGALGIVSGATNGSTSLVVTPKYSSPSDYVGRHIKVGDEFREITAATTSGDNHALTIAALTADATSADLIQKVRMDTDVLEVNHRRGLVEKTSFAVLEVSE